jgi:hypothetical protein
MHYTELSRVTGVPFNYLLTHGESLKALLPLARAAAKEGYVLPRWRDGKLNAKWPQSCNTDHIFESCITRLQEDCRFEPCVVLFIHRSPEPLLHNPRL